MIASHYLDALQVSKVGAQMMAMSATLEDSTAIHNVVAFIRTLQK